MRHSACITLLTFVLAATSLDAQTPASSDHPDHIRGIVLNSVTREPIARALVFSPDNHFATLTNDRGRFDFALPESEPGTNSAQSWSNTFVSATGVQHTIGLSALSARKPGFLARHEGQDMVAIDPSQPEVTLYLVPEARIIGRVVLPGSASFQIYDGANTMQVNLYRRQVREGGEHWDPAGGEVAARSDGEFRFFDLLAGDYKLQTGEQLDRDPLTIIPNGQQFGFPPVFFPSSSDIGSATILHLAAGETLPVTITLTRREYYPVRLPVTNAPSNVRPQIFVWPTGQSGPGFDLGYDPRQHSVRGMLPDGTYTVSVVTRSPAGLSGIATVTIRGAAVFGPTITLVPNPSISVVFHEDFTTRPDPANNSVALHGGILTARGPIEGYNGYLIPDEPFGFANLVSLGDTSSAEHTFYAFDDVPPGRYHIKISGNVGYVAAITAGGTDLRKEPLVVGIGSAPPQIEITMRNDGATINGELIDSTENTAKGTQSRRSSTFPHPIYFLPISGNGTFTTAWTQADGKFQLPNLSPGNYNVMAFDSQQMDIEQQGAFDFHQYESQSMQITVAPNQTQTLRLPVIAVPE